MSPQPSRVSTGVPGLDEVLYGGLLPRRSYLLRGGPGTGKTILGMHFLHEGRPAVVFNPTPYIRHEVVDGGVTVDVPGFGYAAVDPRVRLS